MRADLTRLFACHPYMTALPKWTFDQVQKVADIKSMTQFADAMQLSVLKSALSGGAPQPIKRLSEPAHDPTLEPSPNGFTGLVVIDPTDLTPSGTISTTSDLFAQLQAFPGSRFAFSSPSKLADCPHQQVETIYLPHPDIVSVLSRQLTNPFGLSPLEIETIKNFFTYLKTL